jgi:hypothetical protein
MKVEKLSEINMKNFKGIERGAVLHASNVLHKIN